jgi:hypothetical protein
MNNRNELKLPTTKKQWQFFQEVDLQKAGGETRRLVEQLTRLSSFEVSHDCIFLANSSYEHDRCFVLSDHGQPVGFFALHCCATSFQWRLGLAYVFPSYRRKGLFRAGWNALRKEIGAFAVDSYQLAQSAQMQRFLAV